MFFFVFFFVRHMSVQMKVAVFKVEGFLDYRVLKGGVSKGRG